MPSPRLPVLARGLGRRLPCAAQPAPGPVPASPSVGVPASAQQDFETAQTARVPGSGRQVQGCRAIREQQVRVGAAVQQFLHGPTD